MKKGRGDQDMNKKAWKAGAVSALAVGAGLAAAASKRKKAGKVVKSASDYRNTERGSQEKNSKGIYYSKGNYEAFARPEKPAGIEGKYRRKWIGFSGGGVFSCERRTDAGRKYPYFGGDGGSRRCM